MQRKILVITLAFFIAVIWMIAFCTQTASAKHVYKQPVIKKDLKTNSEILASIDKYQEQYFTIVKRNDVLLNFEDDKVLNKDRKDLKKLYRDVKKHINNKKYLKEYKRIEKKYSNCDVITTTGIDEFAKNNYIEIDKFRNSVYKEVQKKISLADYENLIKSEQKWLKEAEDYEKVYSSKDFGTIGTSVYYDYQTNMKSFRTLLLMLYL